MNTRTAISTLLLTFVLAGAFAAAAQSQAPGPIDSAITDGSLQRSLDDARKRWAQRGPRSYSYEIRRGCYCPTQKTFAVVVKNRRPTKFPAGMKSVATIPRLYALIQRAIDDRVFDLSARFGRKDVTDRRGVPSLIRIDGSAQVADDEFQYDVFRFKSRSR